MIRRIRNVEPDIISNVSCHVYLGTRSKMSGNNSVELFVELVQSQVGWQVVLIQQGLKVGK